MSSVRQSPDSSENLIINSDFQIAQNGTSFTAATTVVNNDDTYTLDQWVILSDGNDTIDVTQDTADAPVGVGACINLEVATANRKFGIIQFLDNDRSQAAIGKTVSLSFDAKKDSGNATLDTIRAAVLSWDSTADSITSDVVSSWAIEGTNPTLVANWTAENTATDLTLTNSYQTFKIEGIDVDTASTNNVAVFIWVDNTDATVADEIFISKVKLEVTALATTYAKVDFDTEILRAYRYYWHNFAYGTAPVQASDAANALSYRALVTAATVHTIRVTFPVPMRGVPSITFYSPASANATWRNATGTADSGTAIVDTGTTISRLGFTARNPQVAGDNVGDLMLVGASADARL